MWVLTAIGRDARIAVYGSLASCSATLLSSTANGLATYQRFSTQHGPRVSWGTPSTNQKRPGERSSAPRFGRREKRLPWVPSVSTLWLSPSTPLRQGVASLPVDGVRPTF